MKSGYKRRIRVLFIASDSARRAQAAAEVAEASGWMEARACCLPSMMAAADPATQEPAWEWPDVVVALDEIACRQVPPLGPPMQVKCYEFPEPADATAWLATLAALQNRVLGMAAGLALMQRAARE